MFNALLSLSCSRADPRASTAGFNWTPGRARRRVRVAAAALHFYVLSGCELDTRPGDGLVGDGLEVTVAPTTVYAQGDDGPDAAVTEDCKALPLFEQKVVPHFLKSCGPTCHDGTKSRAAQALPMFALKDDPKSSCGFTLGAAVGKDLADKLQAPVLTSADPGRQDKVHDFKYKTAAEFAVYRDDVLAWINAERP